MTLSANQLAIRSTRIGSSEIATIAGLNPFQRPIDLWQKKMGLPVAERSDEMEDSAEWGHRMEPVIAAWYEDTCGVRLIESPTLVCEAYPWACATPDRLYADLSQGIEIKNVGERVSWHWQPEIGGEPDYVRAQCHWQMLATGLRKWDVVASVGGASPRIYPVERDDEFMATLVQAGLEFQALIEHETPPPVDGSDSYKDFLSRRFPMGNGRERDESIGALARKYETLRDEVKNGKSAQEEVANQLRARIGNLDEVWGEWGKVSWKTDKSGKRTLRVSSKADNLTNVEF